MDFYMGDTRMRVWSNKTWKNVVDIKKVGLKKDAFYCTACNHYVNKVVKKFKVKLLTTLIMNITI